MRCDMGLKCRCWGFLGLKPADTGILVGRHRPRTGTGSDQEYMWHRNVNGYETRHLRGFRRNAATCLDGTKIRPFPARVEGPMLHKQHLLLPDWDIGRYYIGPLLSFFASL